MNPDIAQAIAQFMQRVNLTGQEVPAWQACMAELQRIIDKSREAAPVE